jgi:2'-5' RNA ligase
MTLHFLGSVPEETVTHLRENLSEAVAGVAPFVLKFRGIGYFPHAKAPKVLWLGVTRVPQPLTDLREAVGALARDAGLELPHPDFHAHVTLARFPALKGTGAFTKMARSYQNHDGGAGEIKSVHLFESLFEQETGVRYESIGEAELGGG